MKHIYTCIHFNKMYQHTCQQRKKKKKKIPDRLIEARFASRITSWWFGGTVSPPPNFLSAQSNSGASGEVNYKYLKFISCVF